MGQGNFGTAETASLLYITSRTLSRKILYFFGYTVDEVILHEILEKSGAVLPGWHDLLRSGAALEGAKPRLHVCAGRDLLSAHRLDQPAEAAGGAGADSGSGGGDHPGAGLRAAGQSGISGLGLSGSTLSLSWTDLSDLFLTVDPGVLFGDDAPWLGGKVLMPTRWKSR